MRSAVGRVALLLFASGLCALVYQTAWLRMFRLIFGASTAASAAVLAIFMAGLGFGGLLLGKRADRHPSPLGFYAALEAGIALSAGLSPWLVELVERVYVSLGGSARLGLGGSTLVRLLLATLMLGLPTFLMGGTLPAVARAVARGTDAGRRVVGLLYAVNTLGAVLGTLVTTFFALEALGIRKTVWIAALLNLLVVLAARNMARNIARNMARQLPVENNTDEARTSTDDAGTRGGLLVPVAAALVGFAFLLMELVWYRMLGPLLGGSSYTFGLILAVALLGIGVGGLLYGAGERRRRPTLLAFALTCSLEALFMALPFAMGDQVAVIAALLRPIGGAGFGPLVVVWTVITALAVLPAAIVAGYQFPLLIALLGSGRRQVGREVGVTYAANTLGAIVGSIAGGFGLIPLLTAPGVWRLVALLLLALAAVAVVAGLRAGSPRRAALAPLAAGAVGLVLALAPGPSVYWRHTAIGAGREPVSGWSGPNDIHRRLEEVRRRMVWEADGVESSVALDLADEYGFIVNGKSDGSALSDAPTQVMSGLLGAAVHPNPRRALVIGLGTGSTAGWLARVPTMERVEVVELEPVIEHVSRTLSPINLGVLSNPKVHLVIGDGRELLLTTDSTYDVIFSEPSNPYRAGIASLFSADFYRAVEQRLRPGGLFLQWLQGYEIDGRAVQTAYATLGEVFPAVESWRVHRADLLLTASREPLVHDLGLVRSRMAQEPYRTAMARTWGVEGLEGFYTSYVASPAFTRALREPRKGAINDLINTDDRPILEFGFARNLGRLGLFNIEDLLALASQRGEHRPATRGGSLDWSQVDELRVVRSSYWEVESPDPEPQGDPAARRRIAARLAFLRDDMEGACALWFQQPEPPRHPEDLLLAGTCLADAGDPRAPQVAARLARAQPIEGHLVLARWHAAAGRVQEAGEHLLAAFSGYRKDPWVNRRLVRQTLPLSLHLSRQDPALGRRIWRALGTPFAIGMFQHQRLSLRVEITRLLNAADLCVASIEPLEPHVPWDGRFLRYRSGCYRASKHPLAERALRDLETFLENEPPELAEGLPAAP